MDGIQMNMFDMIPASKAGSPVWIRQAEEADWFQERFREQVNRGSGFEVDLRTERYGSMQQRNTWTRTGWRISSSRSMESAATASGTDSLTITTEG